MNIKGHLPILFTYKVELSNTSEYAVLPTNTTVYVTAMLQN